jgi:hypothetical protein
VSGTSERQEGRRFASGRGCPAHPADLEIGAA